MLTESFDHPEPSSLQALTWGKNGLTSAKNILMYPLHSSWDTVPTFRNIILDVCL